MPRSMPVVVTMAPTRLTDAEWLQHKPSIRRMIIDQNLSQDETRQQLKDGGIEVTKAQLEYKLKIWGFRKKVAKEKSDAIWQFIGHRVEKRTRQHKASDVFLNGQLVDPAKARKEISRHRPNYLLKLKQDRSWDEPENSRVHGSNHSHSGVNPRCITFVAELPPMVSLPA
ncbi:ankyrin repeat containing protein [Colletotrichum asianum]